MIAVLTGGWSKEREISLQSGDNIYNILKKAGVKCFIFDVKKNNLHQLWQLKFDKAFIIIHGKGGEDGFIQQQLEQRNIAYTGSNSKASKIAMNKTATKKIWQQKRLPTANFIVSSAKQNKDNAFISPSFAGPWIIKPETEGSSIGIKKVNNSKELQKALTIAHKDNDNMIIEQYISGKEYTVVILNNKTLPIIEIEHNNEVWDYNEKSTINNTKYHCPSNLNENESKKIQQLALCAFSAVNCSNWGRVDLMINDSGEIFLLEINTIPGMTTHSLVPTAVQVSGMSMVYFLQEVLND